MARSVRKTKKFQAIREAACSPAGMHGLNKASERLGPKPFAPRHRFFPATDHCSGARPHFRFSRSLLFDAAFRSPTAKTFLANRPAAGLTLPAYIFKAALTQHRTRSVPRSRLRSAFMPHEERSSRATRCPVPSSEPAVCSRAFTPLQDLSILPARSAPPGSGRRNLPCRLPDILRSPQL